MAPFRMPFTSKKTANPSNAQADNNNGVYSNDSNSQTTNDKPSLALGMKERREEPNEFQLSAVSDSGEYLPPSPYEKRSFWGKSPSSTSTTHRSVFSENEPFSISRESFDSYRRSFDISGRSPIIHADSFTSRTSLDSRRLPRPALNGSTFEKPPVTTIEDVNFEDVGLNDDTMKPKKRGFLARLGDSTNHNPNGLDENKPHHFSLIPGRKRGQSGTGSELTSINKSSNRPSSKGTTEVSVR